MGGNGQPMIIGLLQSFMNVRTLLTKSTNQEGASMPKCFLTAIPAAGLTGCIFVQPDPVNCSQPNLQSRQMIAPTGLPAREGNGCTGECRRLCNEIYGEGAKYFDCVFYQEKERATPIW